MKILWILTALQTFEVNQAEIIHPINFEGDYECEYEIQHSWQQDYIILDAEKLNEGTNEIGCYVDGVWQKIAYVYVK